MSRTLIPIKFFTDDITIEPHTATAREHIGRPVTLREFAEGTPLSLYKIEETGEYHVTNGQFLIAPGMPKVFMEGPEV